MTEKPAVLEAHLPGMEHHEPEWVTLMHAHYQKTGLFRTKDLDRVLGDPRKQVTGAAADFALASRLPK